MPRGRATVLVLLTALGAALLSGCVAGEGGYADLERERAPSDALPAGLPADAWGDADVSTARFVGEHEGTRLWVARSQDGNGVCLLQYPDALGWIVGCAGPDGVETFGPGGTFTVLPDGVLPANGTPVSNNVYALG